MSYRSIFLADDWAHQTYYGWGIISDRPGLRILGKRRAIVDRYLLLLSADGLERLNDQVRRLVGRAGLTDIVIHDFDRVLSDPELIAGRHFRLTRPEETLLNTATFVINLAKSDDELMAQMSSDYRRKIRKAGSNGVSVDVYQQPNAALQKHFVDSFSELAIERGLKKIDADALAAMYRDGRGLLLVARKQSRVSNFLHLYKSGDSASFMFGVNLSKENDGAGQFLHFQAMRRLREENVRWYDLGGIVSTDPSDGIFNFKQKFGGELVELGREWRYTGFAASAGIASMQALKSLLSEARNKQRHN